MTLAKRLAETLVEEHPEHAATVLERLGIAPCAELLERSRPRAGAAIASCLSPQFAALALGAVDAASCSEIFGSLDRSTAVRLLRRLEPERQAAVLESVPPKIGDAMRAALRFPENTAGALLDPDALALPVDFSARDALKRIREVPQHTRYNVYVVDDEQRLVGAFNLRELLLAAPRDPLSAIMVPDPLRLVATADRASILAHPGWKFVHSIPVVDERGAYLGAIRYHTLRALETELLSDRERDEDAGRALGQLFAAGAGAFLDAIAGGGRRGVQRGR